jgi:two-component system cell cycle sensor histidine kinase/response regulator CckA
MERTLIDAIPDGVLWVDRAGRVVEVNVQAERLFGYARAELVGQPVEMLIPSRFRETHEKERADYALSPRMRGMGLGLTFYARRKDGSEFPVEISLAPFKQGDESLTFTVVRDVTERVATMQALRASEEEEYRRLFESIPLSAFVHDTSTQRFISVNQAAIDQYGYMREELLAMAVHDLFVPGTSDAFAETLSGLSGSPGVDRLGIWQHRRKDGSVIDVEIVSHVVHLARGRARLSIAMDVTEKRRLEEQLWQSQKLEAVGRLAGGVAHDFNNALAAILGISGILLESLRVDDPVRRDIEDIRTAGERAAALTKQLLAFSRKQVMQPRAIDLNAIVTDVDRMLRRLIGENIDLTLHLAPRLGTVVADPTQIEQVIVNLVVNASDAMAQGGMLTIETSNAELDESHARSHIEVTPGPHVMLAVTDTGVGMDDATKLRIFEPFFSTKGGKGTGLGLATVYGIVKQAGGHIWIYTEIGRGTTFKVYFPRSLQLESMPIQHTLPPAATGGDETILLVEDDDLVRGTVLAILRRKGYALLTARNGGEALLVCERRAGGIDLLLTDVVMPGMSGRELAERLLPLQQGMRVLYMSGYTDDAVVHHGVLDPGVQFIQKPFSPDALARKVREVLDLPSDES